MTTRNLKFFVLFVLVLAFAAAPVFAGNGNGNQPPRPDNRGNEDPCVEQGNCGNGDHGRGRPKCNSNPNSWRGEPDACPTAQPTQPPVTVTPDPTQDFGTEVPPTGTETPPAGTPTAVVDEETRHDAQVVVPAQQAAENGAPAPVAVTAATAAPVVYQPNPYGNCDNKAIALRTNNGTVEGWDDSDVIMIESVGLEPMMTNVTGNWGRSLESSPSLSWNSCWFAVVRVLDGADTRSLWWSDFNGHSEIKHSGESIDAIEVEVGPTWQIVYVDESSQIWLTDRSGSGPIYLGEGRNVDFTAEGNLTLVDNGRTHTIDLSGQEVRASRATDVLRNHPSVEEYDFALSVATQQAIVPFLNGIGNTQLMLEETVDIAVDPEIPSEAAIVVTSDNQLAFTANWFVDGRTVFTIGAFGAETDGVRHEIWTTPDWRD